MFDYSVRRTYRYKVLAKSVKHSNILTNIQNIFIRTVQVVSVNTYIPVTTSSTKNF